MASDEKMSRPVTFRTHRPGDMGYIVHRHGVMYCREYGWDERFEALVARITADFIDNHDPNLERCWIAESDEQKFLGCVMLVKVPESEGTAKLRLLMVEQDARGLGLGKRLIQQCIDFATCIGFQHIVLWTQSVLTSARRLYKEAGFQLMQVEEHSSFGYRSEGER